MGKYEVRWRKKGTKTWHHDRIHGVRNVYYKGKKKYGGGYVTQKKHAHRTLTYTDAVKRMNALKRELGDGYEFMLKHWGSGGRR